MPCSHNSQCCLLEFLQIEVVVYNSIYSSWLYTDGTIYCFLLEKKIQDGVSSLEDVNVGTQGSTSNLLRSIQHIYS